MGCCQSSNRSDSDIPEIIEMHAGGRSGSRSGSRSGARSGNVSDQGGELIKEGGKLI